MIDHFSSWPIYHIIILFSHRSNCLVELYEAALSKFSNNNCFIINFWSCGTVENNGPEVDRSCLAGVHFKLPANNSLLKLLIFNLVFLYDCF